MKLNSKNNCLLIICHNSFNDNEFLITKNKLEKAKINVFIAADSDKICNGQYKIKVKPEIIFENIHIENFDCIILIGGKGIDEYIANEKLQKIILTAYSKNIFIAGICGAVKVIAKSGILKFKKVTGFENDKVVIENYGATYLDQDYYQDGNIITGRNEDSSNGFAELILQKLSRK